MSEDNKQIYKCEECGLEYSSIEWAEKCRVWCSEHDSCNLAITKQAINKDSVFK